MRSRSSTSRPSLALRCSGKPTRREKPPVRSRRPGARSAGRDLKVVARCVPRAPRPWTNSSDRRSASAPPTSSAFMMRPCSRSSLASPTSIFSSRAMSRATCSPPRRRVRAKRRPTCPSITARWLSLAPRERIATGSAARLFTSSVKTPAGMTIARGSKPASPNAAICAPRRCRGVMAVIMVVCVLVRWVTCDATMMSSRSYGMTFSSSKSRDCSTLRTSPKGNSSRRVETALASALTMREARSAGRVARTRARNSGCDSSSRRVTVSAATM